MILIGAVFMLIALIAVTLCAIFKLLFFFCKPDHFPLLLRWAILGEGAGIVPTIAASIFFMPFVKRLAEPLNIFLYVPLFTMLAGLTYGTLRLYHTRR